MYEVLGSIKGINPTQKEELEKYRYFDSVDKILDNKFNFKEVISQRGRSSKTSLCFSEFGYEDTGRNNIYNMENQSYNGAEYNKNSSSLVNVMTIRLYDKDTYKKERDKDEVKKVTNDIEKIMNNMKVFTESKSIESKNIDKNRKIQLDYNVKITEEGNIEVAYSSIGSIVDIKSGFKKPYLINSKIFKRYIEIPFKNISITKDGMKMKSNLDEVLQEKGLEFNENNLESIVEDIINPDRIETKQAKETRTQNDKDKALETAKSHPELSKYLEDEAVEVDNTEDIEKTNEKVKETTEIPRSKFIKTEEEKLKEQKSSYSMEQYEKDSELLEKFHLSKMKELEQQMVASKIELRKIEKDRQIKKEFDELNEDLNVKTKRVGQLEGYLNEAQEKINKNEVELEERANKENQYIEEIQKQSADISDKNEKIEELNSEVKEQEEEIIYISEENSKLKDTLKTKDITINELSNDNKTLNANLETKTTENASLSKNNEKLSRENGNLKESITSKDTLIAQQKDLLDQTKQSYEEEIKRLKELHKEELGYTNKRNNEKIEDIKSDIDKKVKEEVEKTFEQAVKSMLDKRVTNITPLAQKVKDNFTRVLPKIFDKHSRSKEGKKIKKNSIRSNADRDLESEARLAMEEKNSKKYTDTLNEKYSTDDSDSSPSV